jgi:hydrogenase maturation protein HypF
MVAPPVPDRCDRLRLELAGAVQGVGFRPFLFRAARENGLAGWIRNDTRGVTLEVEGPRRAVEEFLRRVRATPPPRAVVREVLAEWLPAAGLAGLVIEASEGGGERLATVLPDLATCPACLGDVGVGVGEVGAARGDRRQDYPFTNCTDCGPRFSIIRALPYDRPNTTMAGFTLCGPCRKEYLDPLDRRFHAQPTACPACGPQLELRTGPGPALSAGGAALVEAAAAIRAGRIVAVQGLGGFHLMVDAVDAAAVARLRERKRRRSKPLAVMAPDLAAVRVLCDVPVGVAALLEGPASPIVLLRRRVGAPVAEGVAPGNPYLGVMLPYTPLHHLLMRELGRAVVATSGNLSDEPICISPAEAYLRLDGIADLFLVHDRPIERAVDDSVAQVLDGEPRLLRRSRGYAPLPVRLPAPVPPILAVGGQLKNTMALARGRDIFLSQHIGDLDTVEAQAAFRRVVDDFLRLYDVRPVATARDLHPDYAATAWAVEHGPGESIPVQHHHAHLASCLAEHGVEGQALGVVWDGTGLGPDGTIWGGEFLLGDASGYRRVAHLRPFRLPGGDAAAREPRRSALALLHAAWGAAGLERLAGTGAGAAFEPVELRVLGRALERGVQAPWTTSAGRLFDGMAALLGLCQRSEFEGEAAMALEYAAAPGVVEPYPFPLVEGQRGGVLVVDWVPALAVALADMDAGSPAGEIAGRFHAGLVAAVVAVAERVGEARVALTGGCFQNRVLTEGAARALRAGGFRPLLHREVPANDGGLALGQVAVAAAVLRAREGR